MTDPGRATIQGDISRADLLVLARECAGKRVVEFGMGGSTTLLARLAGELHSWETDPGWYRLVAGRMARLLAMAHNTALVSLYLSEDVPAELPGHDVLWVDGEYPARADWLRRHGHLAGTVIIHDSRGEHCGDPAILRPLCGYLGNYAAVLSTASVEFHPLNSNLVVIRRGQPLSYVNWNLVESEYRGAHRDPNYIP